MIDEVDEIVVRHDFNYFLFLFSGERLDTFARRLVTNFTVPVPHFLHLYYFSFFNFWSSLPCCFGRVLLHFWGFSIWMLCFDMSVKSSIRTISFATTFWALVLLLNLVFCSTMDSMHFCSMIRLLVLSHCF